MKFKIFLISTFVFFGMATTAWGQVTLVNYSFTGNSADPSTIETGLASTALGLSTGTVGYGTSQSSEWTGSGTPYIEEGGGWTATDSTLGKYFTFTISTDGAESFDLTNISFLHRATGAGPTALTVTVNGSVISSINMGDSETLEYNKTLSLTGITTAEVRIIGWDNGSRTSSGGGALRLDDIVLKGNVSLGSSPILTVDPSTLTGFKYAEGDGPSSEQSFTTSGTNLVSNVSITCPVSSDFEISTNTGAGFTATNPIILAQSGGTVTDTDIYVRLKAGLSQGDYKDTLTVTSTNADTVKVLLEGHVFEAFTIPYTNGLRNQDNYDAAEAVGFTFSGLNLETSAGGYLKIAKDGFGETPTIDFTAYTGLAVQFDLESWGSGTGREFSVLASKDNGATYDTLKTYSVPGSYTTYTASLDLSDTYNVSTGKIKLEMTNGTGSTRFRDFSIIESYVLTIDGTEGWRMLSSPTSDNTYNDLLGPLWTQGITGTDSPTNGVPNVQTYDGSAFTGISDMSTTMTPGQGFITYIYGDDDYTNSSDSAGFPKTISLSGTENTGSVTPTLTSGDSAWTLVGNPYYSGIDWDELDKTNLTGTVYVYDHSYGTPVSPDTEASGSAGSYRVWNGTAGSLTDGRISSFQGFWVQNAESGTPSLTIEEADKISTDTTFFKQGKASNSISIKIRGSMGNLMSESFLSFTQEGKSGKDNFDGLKLKPLDFKNYLNVATLTEETQLAINNLPNDFARELEIPLAVQAFSANSETYTWDNVGGTVMLSWPVLENIPNDWTLTLHDFLTGTSVDMKNVDSYTFTLEGEETAQKINPTTTVLLPQPPTAEKILKKATNPRFTLKVTKGKTSSTEPNSTPEHFALEQNYPNPFNPTTSIQYSVAKSGPVLLTIYNVMGQQVVTLVNGAKSPGTYRISWDATYMASGIYYYRLQAGSEVLTRQMTLIK